VPKIGTTSAKSASISALAWTPLPPSGCRRSRSASILQERVAFPRCPRHLSFGQIALQAFDRLALANAAASALAFGWPKPTQVVQRGPVSGLHRVSHGRWVVDGSQVYSLEGESFGGRVHARLPADPLCSGALCSLDRDQQVQGHKRVAHVPQPVQHRGVGPRRFPVFLPAVQTPSPLVPSAP
jgi:hypothetical protein